MSYCKTFQTLDLILLDLIPLDLILEVISFESDSVFNGIIFFKIETVSRVSFFYKYQNFSDVIAGRRKFWKFVWGIKGLYYRSKILRSEIFFVSYCWIFYEVNYIFVSQCRNFLGYIPRLPIFFSKFVAVFLFKVFFCEYFDLWYFVLSAPLFKDDKLK